MNLKKIDPKKPLNKRLALKKLIYLMQNAHAAEKAAANAYLGHAHSLFITDPKEKEEILLIMEEELYHRKRLRRILHKLGSKPRPFREALMYCVGALIGILSFFGTWIIPMYGAGWLESTNIKEYEVLARMALFANLEELIPVFLDFSEVEWDHELYFREKSKQSRLTKIIGLWPAPPARHKIREHFYDFKKTYEKRAKGSNRTLVGA